MLAIFCLRKGGFKSHVTYWALNETEDRDLTFSYIYRRSSLVSEPMCCFIVDDVLCIWAATWQNQQNGCTPSEDSDQPGHPSSLIKSFADRMKKAWVHSYPLSAQRRLWSDWDRCPGWSESSLGAHSFRWFCRVAANLCYFLFEGLGSTWNSIESVPDLQ